MRCLRSSLPLFALVLLAGAPARAQSPQLYVRHKSVRVDRQPPIPTLPQPGTLTAAQQLAIAPVRWPAVWPAPAVPPGSVLMVPPRPDWQPQPGEYWGPFTDDTGAWGFEVGPMPAAPVAANWGQAAPVIAVPHRMTLGRSGYTAPALLPAPPPAPPVPPQMPVPGPVSPEGQMVVTYPDGNRVTWQFPMVAYVGTLSGIGPGGAVQLTDRYGRRGQFTFATNARITVNGKAADRNHLPAGAFATARALRLAPTEITTLDVIR
jgi:hypothetical protein